MPGEYAQRFDGVGPGRDERPSEMGKVPKDGTRTVKLRMEQMQGVAQSHEVVLPARLVVRGSSVPTWRARSAKKGRL